ncbi:MAG: DNA-deoxyinosine glycosylase, partial [Planctomycetota bacterium]
QTTPNRSHGFPPIAGVDVRVLILGTMPGEASLREQQYYAHPRNAFWPIVAAALGFDAAMEYPARVAAIESRGVAVWDVLRSCVRAGSLDAAIDRSTLEANDFARFFAAHPGIRRVCFNGRMAAILYARHVQPHVRLAAGVSLVELPSTSPANAGVPRSEKARAWQQALTEVSV